MVKQLSGFAIVNVNGGHRISYTYDELDNNGELISSNKKKSFYAVGEILEHVTAISAVIKDKMEGE